MPRRRPGAPRIRKDGKVDQRSLKRADKRFHTFFLAPEAIEIIKQEAAARDMPIGEFVEVLVARHERPQVFVSAPLRHAITEVCQRLRVSEEQFLRESVKAAAAKRGLLLAHLLPDDPA